jgi:hypothetical protein
LTEGDDSESGDLTMIIIATVSSVAGVLVLVVLLILGIVCYRRSKGTANQEELSTVVSISKYLLP